MGDSFQVPDNSIFSCRENLKTTFNFQRALLKKTTLGNVYIIRNTIFRDFRPLLPLRNNINPTNLYMFTLSQDFFWATRKGADRNKFREFHLICSVCMKKFRDIILAWKASTRHVTEPLKCPIEELIQQLSQVKLNCLNRELNGLFVFNSVSNLFKIITTFSVVGKIINLVALEPTDVDSVSNKFSFDEFQEK
jgi:hypothetical protein